MSSENRSSPLQGPDQSGSSALEGEAKRVDDMTGAKDRSREDDQSKQAKDGQTSRVEQDNRVETIARQAKQAGAGTDNPDENLNQDG